MSLVVALGGCAAVLAGVVMALAVATWMTQPALFLGAGTLAGALVWRLVVGVGCRGIALTRRRALHRAMAVTGALLLGSLFVPLGDPVVRPAPPPNAGVWNLPDGTALAYGVVRARQAVAPPVVVVHGGPGVPDLAGHLTALAGLAQDGHDVYAYAQLGAGGSSRLADPRGYSVARAVADLEFVRQQIGAPKVILIGHSYGAYLTAAYLADHPDRVARVVLSSPGDIEDGLSGDALQRRLTTGERLRVLRLVALPRAMLAFALTQVNPAAARAFAGDREMDARMDRVYAATLPALTCRGAGPRSTALHGLGFYANQVPQSLRRPPAPDVVDKVRTVEVPVLVLKGQCDYLDWSSAVSYVHALPQTQVAYIRGAGHDLHVSHSHEYLDVIRAFLSDRDVPHVLADPTQQPPDYQA